MNFQALTTKNKTIQDLIYFSKSRKRRKSAFYNQNANKKRENAINKSDIEKLVQRKSILKRISNLIGLEDFLRKPKNGQKGGKRIGINILPNNYRKTIKIIWKKEFFVICYFISKFIYKLKLVLMSRKFKKLHHNHFEILNDLSHSYKEIRSLNFIDDLQNEYNKIIESSHSNEFKIKLKLLKFCNFFLFQNK